MVNRPQTGESKDDGHRNKQETEDLVPKSAGGFEYRRDHEPEETAALFINSRSVSINLTLWHYNPILSKVDDLLIAAWSADRKIEWRT